jgi:hypothetical protein
MCVAWSFWQSLTPIETKGENLLQHGGKVQHGKSEEVPCLQVLLEFLGASIRGQSILAPHRPELA